MILCNITSGAMTTGVPVGLVEVYNTNGNVVMTDDTFKVKTPGFYELIGEATVTSGAAGEYGLDIMVNDESYAYAYSKATASGEIQTVPLYAVIEIVPADEEQFVEIALNPRGTTPSVVSGSVSIKRLS